MSATSVFRWLLPHPGMRLVLYIAKLKLIYSAVPRKSLVSKFVSEGNQEFKMVVVIFLKVRNICIKSSSHTQLRVARPKAASPTFYQL